MEITEVVFSSEETDFQINNARMFAQWIKNLIGKHKKLLGEINYIFCSDNYLHELNVQHLNHDTLTDIITFDYSNSGIISGDIFISIDRVKENSIDFKVKFENELKRVMAHGVLHLIGFNDKSPEQQKEMSAQEDEAISLFETI